MKIKSKVNKKYYTNSDSGMPNGYLVPIYNIHDNFYPNGIEPKQVYLTAIDKGCIKGPHLHYIRTGCFTCINGNVAIVLKTDIGYQIFKSGEDFDYLSVQIPAGIPAAIKNLSDRTALVINTPYPAWTPEMNDEHTADFSDFDFDSLG